MFFLTFQKRIGKIIAPRIAAFVSLLFLIFEKEMKKKNCTRIFKIRKYAFYNT